MEIKISKLINWVIEKKNNDKRIFKIVYLLNDQLNNIFFHQNTKRKIKLKNRIELKLNELENRIFLNSISLPFIYNPVIQKSKNSSKYR